MPLDSNQFTRNYATACYHRVAKTVIIKGRYDWVKLPEVGNPGKLLIVESLQCFERTPTEAIATRLAQDKPIWTNRHVGLDKALRGYTYTFDFEEANLHDIPAIEDIYQSLSIQNKFALAPGICFEVKDVEQFKCLQLLLVALSSSIYTPTAGGNAIAGNQLKTFEELP